MWPLTQLIESECTYFTSDVICVKQVNENLQPPHVSDSQLTRLLDQVKVSQSAQHNHRSCLISPLFTHKHMCRNYISCSIITHRQMNKNSYCVTYSIPLKHEITRWFYTVLYDFMCYNRECEGRFASYNSCIFCTNGVISPWTSFFDPFDPNPKIIFPSSLILLTTCWA